MAINLSFKEFLDRAREVHGDKFEYIESTFKGSLTRMTIVCKDHGEFLMTPASHTHSKQQCKSCYQDEVVASNRLKYSQRLREKCENNVVISDWRGFRRLSDTVTLNCNLHGEYREKLLNVLRTSYNGCLSCKVLKEGESFVEKAMKIHKGKYLYKKEDYLCSRTLMSIFCIKHNKSFQQRPSAHLQGQGCPDCGREDFIENTTLPQEVFIQRCKDVHGDRYDYSNVKYVSHRHHIEVGCPIHGKFTVRPSSFLSHPVGCKLCYKESKMKHFQEEFIRKVTEDVRYLHMDFSKAVYVNNSSRVKVFCKTHCNWFSSTPNKLLDSVGVSGCKVCAGLSQNRWSITALLRVPNIKETKGYFYTGTISNLNGVKIGITGNIGSRMTSYRTDLKKYKDVSFTFRNTLETTYFKAALMETVVKKVFREFHITHSLDFGGKSEIYDTCCESLVQDFMKGRWDIQIDRLNEVVTGSRSKELLDFVKELKEVYIK